MHKRLLLRASAMVAGGLVLGLGGLGCSPQGQTSFHAIDLTGANYAKNFSLTDHHGQVRQLSDFAGKVVVLFFGYTQCPDVCPTTMMEMAAIKKALGAKGDRLQVLFVSIDPARDTPALLKAYMENFDPSFLALYTTPAGLEALAKDFKVYYKKVEGSSPSSYTMDHSAGSFVYDPQGRLRLFTRYGSPVAELTEDISKLL